MRLMPGEQGSAQWLANRAGKITASRIVDVLDVLKCGGVGAKRRNYRIEIVAERLSGRSDEHFVSADMERGTFLEPEARTAYEMEKDVMVETVGLILHPTFDFAGGSPDGLIGDDGGLEIKVPRMTTHIKWMLEGTVPEEHQPQCLWNMHCAGRSWWDFESYCPELPGLETFIVRMERDEKRIAEIEDEVVRFHGEAERVIEDLRIRMKVRPTPPVDPRSDYDQLMELMDRAELIP